MTDLKSKIEEAKKTLGLNNHELSLKLGHQKRYITNALLDPSVKRQKNIILKINALLLKESNDLTHDFEGKALHKHIDDAMMISKSEYESMKKEIDHKNQVLDKRNAVLENSIIEVNKLEVRVESLQKSCFGLDAENLDLKEKLHLSEQDSEKWQSDFWTVSRENIELINSKRAISIWLAVSILIIVLMLVFGVLHFNGVV